MSTPRPRKRPTPLSAGLVEFSRSQMSADALPSHPGPSQAVPKLPAGLTDTLTTIFRRPLDVHALIPAEQVRGLLGEAVGEDEVYLHPDTALYARRLAQANKNHPGSYPMTPHATASNESALRWTLAHEVGHQLRSYEYPGIWSTLSQRDQDNSESGASLFATAMTDPDSAASLTHMMALHDPRGRSVTASPTDALPPRQKPPFFDSWGFDTEAFMAMPRVSGLLKLLGMSVQR